MLWYVALLCFECKFNRRLTYCTFKVSSCHVTNKKMLALLWCAHEPVRGGIDMVYVHSHTISHPHEPIFHPYHSDIDKEDARPSCFTSTHVVPAGSKVHLEEWMSERSKSTSAWMGSLCSQALLLCWQENKCPITPPCDGAHRTDDDEVVWKQCDSAGPSLNNYFLTSSCKSDECVTRPTEYNSRLPPCVQMRKSDGDFSKGNRVSHC